MEPKDQGNQQPSQGNQPEPMHKIKVQGEEKELPLSKVLELAQKGDDYELKMKTLKEDREKMGEETQRKAEELAEQYLTNLAQEQPQQPQQPAQEPLDPQDKRIADLEQKLAKMEGSTEETKVAQYELQYEKNLADCKTKFPLMDEKVILATLSANPQLNMEELAKESHEGKEKERDGWIKDYLESKTKQPKETGGGPSAPPLTPPKEMSGKDLIKGNVKRAATEFIREQ